MKKIVVIFGTLWAIVLSGCARHFTIDPEFVPQKNSADWIVKSEPAKVKK